MPKPTFENILVMITFGLFMLHIIFKISDLYPDFLIGYVMLFDGVLGSLCGASFYSLLLSKRDRYDEFMGYKKKADRDSKAD